MNYRSLAFRLGALYTLLLSATFALVGTGTFYGLQQYLRSNLRDSLSRRSTQVEQILMQASVDATDNSIVREIDTRIAPEFNNRFVRVTREPATLVYRSGPPANRSFDPSALSVANRAGAAHQSSGAVASRAERLLHAPLPADQDPTGAAHVARMALTAGRPLAIMPRP